MAVVAVAGRRIDPARAEAVRFPLDRAPIVYDRVYAFLQKSDAHRIVSSAACGADLLALRAARALRLRYRIVLPFERRKFREVSVRDRPGNWGALFDEILDDTSQEDIIVLPSADNEDQSYVIATYRILTETEALAAQTGESMKALVVWDGKSRGNGDITDRFRRSAMDSGMEVAEVLTL